MRWWPVKNVRSKELSVCLRKEKLLMRIVKSRENE